MTRKKRESSGIVIPHKPRWYERLAAWAIFGAIQLVSVTLRSWWTDKVRREPGQPMPQALYCAWHNRLVLSMIAYRQYVQQRNRRPQLAAMVSASKDGGFLAAILECFQVHPVRGSSSRRGRQALLELTTYAEQGYDLAITPDGPRGPRYKVQEGVMSLARVTGLPIVPFSFHVRWKIQVKSWDRFQIPLPFSRCEFVMGEQFFVPREASDEEREALRQQLEERLNSLAAGD
jgi:lysophospholipid acyltransferase (LPLAT)-like uncharacterized protein